MIKKVIDRVFAAAGAIFFAQFPQFIQQYTQDLSGHVGELSYQVSLLEQSAELSHKNLSALIAKFTNSTDFDYARQGELMQNLIDRFENLKYSLDALNHASIFTKPFTFLRYADSRVFKETVEQFQWGFSFTSETLIYAFLGTLAGYGVFQSLKFFINRIFFKRSQSVA